MVLYSKSGIVYFTQGRLPAMPFLSQLDRLDSEPTRLQKLAARLPRRLQPTGFRLAEYLAYVWVVLKAAGVPTGAWLRDLRSEALLLSVGAVLFVALLVERHGFKGSSVHQLGPSLLWTTDCSRMRHWARLRTQSRSRPGSRGLGRAASAPPDPA